MPKPRQSEQSNLACTLDAIAQLPDEAIAAWGKVYDWTQPVECLSPSPYGKTTVLRQAGDLLLRRRDARLNKLLLRGDMFDTDGKWNKGSYRDLLSEHDEGKCRPFVSEDAMLTTCLDTAIEISDLQSAAVMERGLSTPNQYGAMRRYFVNLPSGLGKTGLFANCEPKPALEEAVGFCERAVVLNARHFRGDSRRKIALFEQDHLHAWRHWMCVAAIRLDSPRLFQHLHASIGGVATQPMIDTALIHERWDILADLCQIARARGLTEVAPWIQPLPRVGNAPIRAAGNTPELAAEIVLDGADRKEWVGVLTRALSGQFDVPGERSCREEFIPVLMAEVATEWPPGVASALAKRFPVASMAEMVALLCGEAPDEAWNARLSTIQVRGEHALWTSLAHAVQDNPSGLGSSHVQIDRLGQLFALAPSAFDGVQFALGSAREPVQAAMQRHMLHHATAEGVATPRARRM